jgi:hypothetical protein
MMNSQCRTISNGDSMPQNAFLSRDLKGETATPKTAAQDKGSDEELTLQNLPQRSAIASQSNENDFKQETEHCPPDSREKGSG